MQTNIISRVAEFIRNPESQKKAHDEPVSSKINVQDTVEISTDGQEKLSKLEQTESQWEKERMDRLDKIKERMASGNYTMHPQMVDEIAEKIVKIL